MQNTLSPNQKLRKAIDAWVSEDTENKNFDAAMVHKRHSQEYFRRAREMDK